MATIIGLSGSLRRGSFNSMLLRALAEAAPAGSTVDIASIRDIPLYDGDVESQSGVPAAVEALKNRIAAADGLLIVTPEYNNSIPGVLKNAIDWLTRPPADIGKVFRGRPVAIAGTTTGRGATALSQAAWLPVLRAVRVQPFFDARLAVPNAKSVFDDQGRITDDTVRDQVRAFIEGFAAFVERLR